MTVRSICLLILICMLLCCAMITAQDFGDVSDVEWKLVPPADFPDIKALIIFDHGDMLLTTGPLRVKTERHVRIKVFTKDGADDALNIEIPYSQGDKIVGLKAHTINPGGKKTKVKDIHDKKIGAYHTLAFSFPAVEDGAILEYKYKLSHQRITFLDPWYFQNSLYTIESRFSITPNPGFAYSTMTRFMPEVTRKPHVEQVYTVKGEMTKFTWTLYKLPPFKDEPLSYASRDYRTSIFFQLKEYRDTYQRVPFFKDWGYIGGIIGERVEQLAKKGENKVKELSDSLCANCAGRESRIEACFHFVNTEIYSNESSENDTFREILEKREASSTDKNILLAHLLRAQDIESYPMMIGTRDEFSPLDRDISQLNTLNSVICTVNEDDRLYGLDTGPQNTVYPYLPKLCRVKNGLKIWMDSCGIFPLYHRQRSNGCDVASTMHIDRQGTCVCTTNVYIRGYSMDGLLDDIDSQFDADAWFRRLFGDVAAEYHVVEGQAVYERQHDRIKCDFIVEFPGMCTEIDGNFVFCPFTLNCFTNPFTSKYRMTPIDFRYSFRDRTQLHIQLPENMRVYELPDDIEHTLTNLAFTRHNRAVGNIIEINSTLAVDEPVFSMLEYGSLKNTFDALQALNEDEILFTAEGETHE